jgi:hypothetical protein
MYKVNRIVLVALAINLCLVGIIEASGPWVPIVKDGSEQQTTVSAYPSAINLVGSSPVAFSYLRGQVKAVTDPTKIDKIPDYGAFGLMDQLTPFLDDQLPIATNDYYWQSLSPIYYNPHMDFYWGQTSTDYGEGNGWYESLPTNGDVWGDTTLGWDKVQTKLDSWANEAI